MNDTKTQLDSIQEAYMGVITEGVESKFKVGDKVGIGHLHSHMNNGNYYGVDSGTVKSAKGAVHSVEYDNIKNKETGKPLVRTFANGTHSQSDHSIVDLNDHEKSIADEKANNERNTDIGKVFSMLNANKLNHGGFSKIGKIHADHIKSLLDKHTEE